MQTNRENAMRSAPELSVLYVVKEKKAFPVLTEILQEIFTHIDFCDQSDDSRDCYLQNKHDLIICDTQLNGSLKLCGFFRELDPEQKIIIVSTTFFSQELPEFLSLGAEAYLLQTTSRDKILHILNRVLSVIRLHKMEKDYQFILENNIKAKTEQLHEALDMVNTLTNELVIRLSRAAECRNLGMGGHVKRIGLFAMSICDALNLDQSFRDELQFAAPLHDIGKIGIPDDILLKEGPLNEDEYDLVKKHTILGANILSDSKFEKIRKAKTIALYHHEKWDGSGYPYGLRGDEIPRCARILSLCDHYDALRSKRPYKESFSHAETCGIILEGDAKTKPSHFDPEVLAAFRETEDAFDRIYDANLDLDYLN